MKKILALILVIAMALLFVACGGETGEDDKTPDQDQTTDDGKTTDDETSDQSAEETKIGVSILEMTAYTWFLGAQQGCLDWAEDHPEANFTFQFEDSRSDVSTMIDNVENMITAGAKGIIIFPCDASSSIPTMKKYTKEGIKFVIGDYPQQAKSEEDEVWETFVGHDMKALGVSAGKVAVEYLKTLGKDDPTCLFITVPTSGQVAIDRFEGFKETVLAEFPNAKIIEEGDTNGNTRDSAQSLMENILQREDNIDVVCGHNDAAVIGAYNAAVAMKRDECRFIGIAGNKDVLTFISEGNDKWLGEVLQDPVVLGYQAADAMYRALILGEDLPEKYELPEPEAITPDNISDYDWESWKWL